MNPPPRTVPKRIPRLSRGKKVLFALGTCLFLFVVVEVGWRLALGWKRDWRDSHCWHPTLGWCLRPGWSGNEKWTGGAARINPQGIRDDRPVGPKAAGEKRLLVLGDSVTFGAMVPTDQTYPAQLEKHLKQGNWRVLNGGVTAYDSSQEAEWLELFGWKLEPDVLAIGFCRNDVQPSRRTQHMCPKPVGGVGQWLTDHSILAYKLQRTLWSVQAKLGLATATEKTATESETQTLSGWPLVEQSYRRIAAKARERQVPVILLIYPTLDLLTGKTTDDLSDRLQALGRELGWQVVDLAPAFAKESSTLFLPGDPVHPSEAGYQRAAVYSARVFSTRGSVR